MTDVMRKRRSLESFRFGRRDEEVAIGDVPLPENERRCSLRSFGGSMRSMFGRENSANPLSEFQQQSLSVFESEHMWSHFKAHLEDNKIQTSAGVRAMLPEFVNDRVMDGSVGSDRPVYPISKRSSFAGSSNHSMDVSDRCHSSIDYSQALRGDTGYILSLHETSNREAHNNSDSKGLGKIIPACFTIDNTRRRSSVFSSLGWNDDEPSDDDDCPLSSSLDLSSRLSLDSSSRSRLSLDSSSRRVSFLASLGLRKDLPFDIENEPSSEEAKRKTASRRPKFVRPVESAEQNGCDIVQDYNQTVDEGDGDTSKSKPFTYRPSRNTSKAHDARKRTSISSSRASTDTDTLLVEWGENGELSSEEEEDDRNPISEVDDIERTVVTSRSRNCLIIVDWNEKEDGDSDSDSEEADTVDCVIFPVNSVE